MRIRKLIVAMLALLLPVGASAAAMDWRIYFTADMTGALSEAAVTGFLFEINGEDDLAGISEVIRKGAVNRISSVPKQERMLISSFHFRIVREGPMYSTQGNAI